MCANSALILYMNSKSFSRNSSKSRF